MNHLDLNTQKNQVNYNICKEMIEFCSTSVANVATVEAVSSSVDINF